MYWYPCGQDRSTSTVLVPLWSPRGMGMMGRTLVSVTALVEYWYQCRAGSGTGACVRLGPCYQYHCGISGVWYWNWYWCGHEPGAGTSAVGAPVPVLATSGGGALAQQRCQYRHSPALVPERCWYW